MGYTPKNAEVKEPSNFIENFINEDIENGKVKGPIITRFPPEPNGYLHIGHLKAIWIDFSIAQKYQGLCNLRYDDTNPDKEDVEFAEAQVNDIRWMGFDITGSILYGSDYFDKTYEFAKKLIKDGLAYVDELSPEETREYRGTLKEPGKNSPYRDRPIEESLDLFERMKNGEFRDGERTLRAKIDMQSPNINMRDPVLYRIKHAHHWRAGDKWCIYPMYDYAHPIQDALEGITHSLCSLEYEAHRPLYNWVIDSIGFEHKPRQIEFARMNITGTIMSKRYQRQLVEEGHVNGWDDPRMPTISGLRRRGFPAAAINDFIGRAGVAKADSVIDYKLLEHCVRENLNDNAPRAMVVLDPIKVVLTNYPEDKKEIRMSQNHPKVEEMGTREVPLSREIYIERMDFMEEPVKKYRRLKPEGEVRLKDGYIIKHEKTVKDEEGNIVELHCSYDPTSHTGGETAGRKIKGTIHWVDANDYVPCEVRLYDSLLLDDAEGETFIDRLNPDSLTVMENAVAEKSLGEKNVGDTFQFMRQGYFAIDPDSTDEKKVFNRVVALRDSFSKSLKK